MAKFIIEICPNEPRASICGMNGESVAKDSDLADCRASGDVQPACEYVRDLPETTRKLVMNYAESV